MKNLAHAGQGECFAFEGLCRHSQRCAPRRQGCEGKVPGQRGCAEGAQACSRRLGMCKYSQKSETKLVDQHEVHVFLKMGSKCACFQVILCSSAKLLFSCQAVGTHFLPICSFALVHAEGAYQVFVQAGLADVCCARGLRILLQLRRQQLASRPHHGRY